MARQRLIDAPPRNDVYVGMLGLTALAMFAGVVVLLLEFGLDYDFAQEAKGGPPISLPKDYSRPTPKTDGSAPAVTPAVTPVTKAAPTPPAAAPLPPEVPPPAVAATVPPVVLEPLAVPRPATVAPEPVAPAVAPAVVRPGFIPRIPR